MNRERRSPHISEHHLSVLPASPEFLETIEAAAWRDHQLAAPLTVRQRFDIDVQEVEGALVMRAARGPLGMNRVVNLGVGTEPTGHIVAHLVALYESVGISGFLTLWSPLASSRVRADLDRHGATVRSRMAKLYRRPATDVVGKTSFDIVTIGAESAAQYGRTIVTAHGDPPELADAHAGTVGRPHWRHYLAFDGHDPVAGAALFWTAGIAWCGFSATLPEARRHGAHSALLAQRIRDAALLNCTWVVCETAEDQQERPNPAYRNMRRAGFELAYYRDVLLLNT